jgi:DNA-binding beta-propeller fold protein YncE
VAVTPDGRTADVADGPTGTVTPVTLATQVVGSPISVPGAAYAVAITPGGKLVYATDFSTGAVGEVTPINLRPTPPRQRSSSAANPMRLRSRPTARLRMSPTGTTEP